MTLGELLCAVGLHDWSEHRGGIQICRRHDCTHARTFGITGVMRKQQWRESLYKKYTTFEEQQNEY